MLIPKLMNSYAINYCWRELCRRAGFDESLFCRQDDAAKNISFHYGAIPAHRDLPTVVVIPANPKCFESLVALKDQKISFLAQGECLPRATKMPFEDQIPILFESEDFKEGKKTFAVLLDNRTVVFYADIIAAAFFMLSRWEETVNPIRDDHDRFLATQSVAYKHGFLHRPIIDEYALILQSWIKVLLPGWEPVQRRFTVKLTHDVDLINRFQSPFDRCRTLCADIVIRRDLRLARENMTGVLNNKKNSLFNDLVNLANISEQHGLKSSFYFMGALRGRMDIGYNINDSGLKKIIHSLLERGHEIGFHAGYHTYIDEELFIAEKKRVEDAVSCSIKGGRQHYLRFKIPVTWNIWENSGLNYDSTLGYADHEGFRCGTCHPYKPYDLVNDKEMNLTEIPLIIMDGTLRDYRRLNPEQGFRNTLDLIDRCRKVSGTFTILWHNSLPGYWYKWTDVYIRLLDSLTDARIYNHSF